MQIAHICWQAWVKITFEKYAACENPRGLLHTCDLFGHSRDTGINRFIGFRASNVCLLQRRRARKPIPRTRAVAVTCRDSVSYVTTSLRHALLWRRSGDGLPTMWSTIYDLFQAECDVCCCFECYINVGMSPLTNLKHRRHHCRHCGGLVCDDCSRQGDQMPCECSRHLRNLGSHLGKQHGDVFNRDLSCHIYTSQACVIELPKAQNSNPSRSFPWQCQGLNRRASENWDFGLKDDQGAGLRWLFQGHRRPPCNQPSSCSESMLAGLLRAPWLRAQVKAAVLEEDLALGRHLIEQLKGRRTGFSSLFLALWPC